MPVQNHEPGMPQLEKLAPGDKPKKQATELMAQKIKKSNFIMGYNKAKSNSTHRITFRKSKGHTAASPSEDLQKMKEHFSLGMERGSFQTTNSESFVNKSGQFQ